MERREFITFLGGAAGLRRLDLAGPALERRAMAFPEAQERIVAGQTGRLEVGLATSALGQKQTFSDVSAMSALPPKADIGERDWHVRFVPKADIVRWGERRRY